MEIEKLNQRLENLENTKDQEIVTLVEILANITFFGQMKKALCQNAKDGQCRIYIIDGSLKEKVPFTSSCKIKDCREPSNHSHIEISNITCGLCHETSEGPLFDSNSKQKQTFKQSRIDKLWQEKL